MITIHPIQTGTLFIKRRHRRARVRSQGLRFVDWFLDRQFVEIPVLAWVIQHPQGLIVVDSGETARSQEPDFFSAGQRPFMQRSFRWAITPEQEIGPQMRRLGLPPEEVETVVLTHAHMDHSNGLHHFPNARVLLSRAEHDELQRAGERHGAVPSQWPDWLRLVPVDYVPEAIGPFAASFPLSADGSIRLVPTPGHTVGHQSVIVQSDGFSTFIAGDASFDVTGLREQHVDGVSFDADLANATQKRILEYATYFPTVYLPSHDWDSPGRLGEKTLLDNGGAGAAKTDLVSPPRP